MKKVFSVGQINKYIKNILEEDIILQDVFISGEISNFKESRHYYFTLKDDNSAISCVMFSGNASNVTFKPENGMKVLVFGRISLYEKTGNYQVYIELMEPEGVGQRQMAFEQLKNKLDAKGYFATTSKKAMPEHPKVIALLTSPTGAVIKDMISVSRRRDDGVELVLIPTIVQGCDSENSIVDSLEILDEWGKADVAVLARGGGSAEDLWSFNEERVADAIYHCHTPLVSAVGHETDYTISDFVADLRAPTPSAAIEMILPLRQDKIDKVTALFQRLSQVLTTKLTFNQRKLSDLLDRRALQSPEDIISGPVLTLQNQVRQLDGYLSARLQKEQSRYTLLVSNLNNLSPLNILKKGYAIVYNQGKVVKDAQTIKQGDIITIRTDKSKVDIEVANAEKTEL